MIQTLEDLKVAVSDYASDCGDAVTNMRSFNFGASNSLSFSPDLAGSAKMGGALNDWSFQQVCARMGVPADWLGNEKRCPEQLKVDILNSLATVYREDANFLVRMKGEVIRAILSSKYTQFDNVEFLDLITEAISTMGIEPQIHRSTVGDELRSYILFPQVTLAPDPEGRDNGGLHPSLYISNSERGGGSAKVAGAVFRSICTNGLIYGWKQEETFDVRHRFRSRAAMGLLVAEGIATGLQLSEEATERFVKAQDIRIPQISLASVVNDWTTKYGITVDARDNWLASITSETASYGRLNDPRLFDMVNAATYVAQSRNPVETELMERMAGDLLGTVKMSRSIPNDR